MKGFEGFGYLLVQKLIKEVSKEDAIRMVEFWTFQGMIDREQAATLLIEIEDKYKDD